MQELTIRQKAIFEAICDYQNEYDNMPTVRELCNIFNLKSTGTVRDHLKEIIKKEYIEKYGRGKFKFTGRGKAYQCSMQIEERLSL